jgi:hypothetical protein
LFPILVFAHIFFNPNYASVKAISFTSQKTNTTNLYDLMEIDDEMSTRLVMKEQLNHCKVKKVTKKEGKN